MYHDAEKPGEDFDHEGGLDMVELVEHILRGLCGAVTPKVQYAGLADCVNEDRPVEDAWLSASCNWGCGGLEVAC